MIVGYLAFCLLFTAIYFLHTKILFPLLYTRKKHGLYFGILLLLLVIIALAKPFDYFISQPTPQGPIPLGSPSQEGSPGPLLDIVSIFLFLLAVIIGVAAETNKQLRLTMQRALQAETEKANAELAFLRAQVNPHFMFNTLNALNALIVQRSGLAAEQLIEYLSTYLRHSLKNQHDNLIPLQQELDALSAYMAIHNGDSARVSALSSLSCWQKLSQFSSPIIPSASTKPR